MSSELTTKNDIKAFLANPDIQQRMNDLLKERASEFATSILAAVQNDDKLAKCDPATIFSAAMTAASLNLPINSNLGFAYIIPYNGKAQFQMGWKGFVQLAQRTGQYKTIGVTEVYEGQLVEENPVLGNSYDWNAKVKGGEVIGYVAMFQLVTGFEKSLYMSVEQLKKHGLKFSQSYKKGYGLWKDDFHSMALKTVLKLLISKFGPMNTSVSKAVEFDQSVINGDALEYADNQKPARIEQSDEEREKLKQEARDIAAKRKAEAEGGEDVPQQ